MTFTAIPTADHPHHTDLRSRPMSPTFRALTLLALLGTGAVGGVLFAFSSFVMPGLKRLPSAQGIEAMQSINVTAVRPAFMTAFLGTALLCVVLTVRAFMTWGDRRAVLLLVASVLYVVGTIGLTIGYHVPMNDDLATLQPHSAAAAAQWADYVSHWTLWNHVRAGAALAATAVFAFALAE
jgi:uncharacterized membrane protein